MGEGFVKLFSSILDSSVWGYDAETRLVWITLLAMADSTGKVHAAIPGIANRARVSIQKTEEALRIFQEPDRYSRSRVHDGRRIQQDGRDWLILNFKAHRDRQSKERERERKREWWRRNRAKKLDPNLDELDATSKVLEKTRHIADAEADAEADTVRSDPSLRSGSTQLALMGDKNITPISPTTVSTKQKKRKTKTDSNSKGGPTWEAYEKSYEMRYEIKPVRNAQSNTFCARLVDRLGAEEAPLVAAYYPWTRNGYHVQRGHSLKALLGDAEKIRTEWKTGRQITQAKAREDDRLQETGQAWQDLADEYRREEQANENK